MKDIDETSLSKTIWFTIQVIVITVTVSVGSYYWVKDISQKFNERHLASERVDVDN